MGYIVAIALYLAAIMVYGLVLAHKKVKTTDDMMTGGHRIPFIILVGSLLATWCGGGGITGSAGVVYTGGPWVGAITFAAPPIGIILLYFTAGQRMVLDDEGVHLYRLGLHTRSLPWEEIREWGTRFENNFAKDRLTKPFCYYFFFTTEAGIYGGKGYLFMEISKNDYKTLPKSAIRRYVKTRLNTEENE